jgi:hypothetical protein
LIDKLPNKILLQQTLEVENDRKCSSNVVNSADLADFCFLN